MLGGEEQEIISRIRQALSKTDKTIALYRKELRKGRFRPRQGEKWERTGEAVSRGRKIRIAAAY